MSIPFSSQFSHSLLVIVYSRDDLIHSLSVAGTNGTGRVWSRVPFFFLFSHLNLLPPSLSASVVRFNVGIENSFRSQEPEPKYYFTMESLQAEHRS
jgi:hypothetical protein